ncbi:MAG: hypothetical protein HY756_08090 [Nitrospirae bacterium]|nr:hypothetical protein [Nitrospirota bacterium]
MGIDIYVKKDGKSIYYEGIGSGTNFYEMRLAIAYSLENGEKGSRFPVLQRTPSHEAVFTMEQTKELKREIEAIISEQDNIKEEYKNIPYLSLPGEPPMRDFSFPRKAIIERLKIILEGCVTAIANNGTLQWDY